MVVPVDVDGDSFGRKVLGSDGVGGLERGNCVRDATGAPQLVALHVPRVRNFWRQPRINLGFGQRVLRAVGGRGGFIEAGAESDGVAAVGLRFHIGDRVGQVAIDLAEILFLSTGERRGVACGGESDE